tara:strand:- start:833 stop:979 length:147 start_codon:yes stop_codon:yes gene_type:complete
MIEDIKNIHKEINEEELMAILDHWWENDNIRMRHWWVTKENNTNENES